MKANPIKYTVYFGGVHDQVQQNIVETTKFWNGTLPFKYLGVPLYICKLNIHHNWPLMDKIVARIKYWTAKLLSYADKTQLIKSVIFAITTYWMQAFPLPKKVINQIESICRNFLWSDTKEISKKTPISWDRVCNSKAVGELNITSLRECKRKLTGWTNEKKTLIQETKKKDWKRKILKYWWRRQSIAFGELEMIIHSLQSK